MLHACSVVWPNKEVLKMTFWDSSLRYAVGHSVNIRKFPKDLLYRLNPYNLLFYSITGWKVSRYGVFSGSYFPVYRKVRTWKKSLFWHFSHSEFYSESKAMTEEQSFNNFLTKCIRNNFFFHLLLLSLENHSTLSI